MFFSSYSANAFSFTFKNSYIVNSLLLMTKPYRPEQAIWLQGVSGIRTGYDLGRHGNISTYEMKPCLRVMMLFGTIENNE